MSIENYPKYTYRVMWSENDQCYIGTCLKLLSLRILGLRWFAKMQSNLEPVNADNYKFKTCNPFICQYNCEELPKLALKKIKFFVRAAIK